MRKSLGARLSASAAVAWLMAAQVPFFVAWGAIEGWQWPARAWLLPGLTLVALNVLSNVLFIYAVTISPLSKTVPFLALTPVFSALAGLFVGDTLSTWQWTGAIAVVAGAFLLQRGRLTTERGVPYMIVVALLWSVVIVLDREALAYATPAAHGAIQMAAMAVPLGAGLWLLGRGAELAAGWRAWPWVLATAAGSAVALALQLLALQETAASNVESVKRAIGLVAALVFGRLAFAEAVDLRMAAAVAVMGAGAVAVILG